VSGTPARNDAITATGSQATIDSDTGELAAPKRRTLRGTMFAATVLVVLYGLSFPTIVLSRLLPAAQRLEQETTATNTAFQTLREQGNVFQGAVTLARRLNENRIADTAGIPRLIADTVEALRGMSVLEYNAVADQMRDAFAGLVSKTDEFTAKLDEAGRAYRLGEDSVYHARIRTALDSVSGIAQSLDEAQRHGLGDLLDRQARINAASAELQAWTIGWLLVGGVLIWFLVSLTRRRLIDPLDRLERGLTQLSSGDLEARIRRATTNWDAWPTCSIARVKCCVVVLRSRGDLRRRGNCWQTLRTR
jgi:HAMP domain-containing protein